MSIIKQKVIKKSTYYLLSNKEQNDYGITVDNITAIQTNVLYGKNKLKNSHKHPTNVNAFT